MASMNIDPDGPMALDSDLDSPESNIDDPSFICPKKPVSDPEQYSGHFVLNIPTDQDTYTVDPLKIEPSMVDWMNEKSPPHPFYIQYRMYQAKALSASTRRYLSEHLNPEVEVGDSSHGLLKDWRGLAECMNKNHQFTINLNRFKDPTAELILTWQTEEGSTMGRLVEYLHMLDRYDILHDIKFMNLIKRSCKEYDLERERELRERKTNEDPNWTVGDVENHEFEKFDAFVCYSQDDHEFMTRQLIQELEVQRDFKLCIDARDLLDPQNHTITAEVIRQRCKCSIVILSRNFVQEDNKLCEFTMRVAQSLSPAASRSRIIPILIDRKCMIPTSLRHLTLVDYTRPFQRKYMWQKIAATMKDTVSTLCLVEQEKLRLVTLVVDTSDTELDVRKELFERQRLKEVEDSLNPGRKEEEEEDKIISRSKSSFYRSPNGSGYYGRDNNCIKVRIVPSDNKCISALGDKKSIIYRAKKMFSKILKPEVHKE